MVLSQKVQTVKLTQNFLLKRRLNTIENPIGATEAAP